MPTDTKTEKQTRSRRSSSGTSSRRSSSGTSSRRTDRNERPEDRRFLERHGDRLSDSTKRARWIHSPDERPDRRGQTLATRSPEVIRAWAEARGGQPVTATRGDDGRP